jgi:hypothetical protein
MIQVIPRANHKTFREINQEIRRAQTGPVPQSAEGFIKALPFGAATDCCRNVMDAGQCPIQWRFDLQKR